MKSLSKFPKARGSFNVEDYAHDVRTDCCAESPYSGGFGIELELEGVGLPGRVTLPKIGGASWVAHEDGSLRNGGMEYVLSQPCDRQHVTPLCDQLFAYLKSYGATVKNSTRCSTHVHLNMKGVKVNELAAFVSLWGIFEDALSIWCGDHRSGNHFALRFSDSHWAIDAWVNAFQTGDFRFSRERRYLALNAACLSTFGSLEVRTMRGADSAAEVEEWVAMLDALRTAAKRYSDPSFIAAEFSGDGSRFFAERVFGPAIAANLDLSCAASGESFDSLVRSGIRRVQPIIYSLPWSDVLPEVTRVYVPNPFSTEKPRKARLRDLEDMAPMRAAPGAPRFRVQ